MQIDLGVHKLDYLAKRDMNKGRFTRSLTTNHSYLQLQVFKYLMSEANCCSLNTFCLSAVCARNKKKECAQETERVRGL